MGDFRQIIYNYIEGECSFLLLFLYLSERERERERESWGGGGGIQRHANYIETE